MTVSILWFRRDLRLGDNPALLACRDSAEEVLPVFVLDPALQRPSGGARLAFLDGCLAELRGRTGGALRILHGDPVSVIPRLASDVGAETVHVAADYGPYGARRDRDVENALRDVDLVRTGSSYANAPGTIRGQSGGPFKVFTPFSRAWRARGWSAPAPTPRSPRWTDGGIESHAVPETPKLPDVTLPRPGEQAAGERFAGFREADLTGYDEGRNVMAADATSRLSAYLKFGCIHPRTILAGLGDDDGSATYRNEICWRDFYADVLFQQPQAIRDNILTRFDAIDWDTGGDADRALDAWKQGRTGYPVVDAGMRQLLAEGWIHNRARMIVGSFLVKDLHLHWRLGARHFMAHLVDGDVASNQLGWQWVAGTGTDPAPFFRVFNPTLQGRKFDPDGDYVRRYVPELRGIGGATVHEPWALPGGVPAGYVEPIVEHRAEREVALARYQAIR